MPGPGSDSDTDVGTASTAHSPSATTLSGGDVNPQQHTSQHVEVHGAGGGKEERKQGGAARNSDSAESHSSAMTQLLEGMRQMQHMMMQQQQRIEELEAGKDRVMPMAGRGAAEALRSPIPSGRYPTTAARNGTFNRPSFGLPANPYVEDTPPSTPMPRVEQREEHVERRVSQSPSGPMTDAEKDAEDKRVKDVLTMMRGMVDPFYGDTVKDKSTTVTDWVEKLETSMNDILRYRPEYRLMVVRAFIREGAMRWTNDTMDELTARALRRGRDLQNDPITWDADVRTLFIKKHVGQDTVTLWLSKLSQLRLGSHKTPTPIELDSQFDSIARHVYPTRDLSDPTVDLLLTQEYSKIVYQYSDVMWNNITSSLKPKSMAQWKERLSEQFVTAEEAKAMRRSMGTGSTYRGGYKGRGGGGRYNDRTAANEKPTGASAASMSATDGAGAEGQRAEDEEESDSTEQVNATNSSRGGQGGDRGGRGRGGGNRQQFSADRQKLYDEDKCFNCKEVGHRVKDCTKPRQQPGNA